MYVLVSPMCEFAVKGDCQGGVKRRSFFQYWLVEVLLLGDSILVCFHVLLFVVLVYFFVSLSYGQFKSSYYSSVRGRTARFWNLGRREGGLSSCPLTRTIYTIQLGR